MKKFLIALAAAFILCVPAFASDSYFSSGDYEVITSSGTSYKYSSVDNTFSYFLQPFNGSYKLFVISNIQNASGNLTITYSDLTSNSSAVSCSNSFASGQSWVAPVAYSFDTSYSFNPSLTAVPSDWSNQDIEDAFLEYLSNLPSSSGNKVTVHVPYGNVLYIKVDQRQEDIQLVAHMPKLSFLIPDRNFGYWGETGICWGDYNTLPYSGLTFPLQGMSGIDWQRDSSRNILGQTKTGVATKIMNTGVWYALFCPSMFGHFDLDSSAALPGASVDVTGVFSDIRLYPLSDSYSFVDNEVINGSNSEFQDYLDGEPTESGTVTWTDQDGNVAVPRAGGSSYVPESETAESLVSQIKNILGNIVKELQTLFTFGYDAIQTLVNLMSDFVSGFSQLYTWLPAPVYSALIAAITVAIVIGVFKVFL